MHEKPADAVRAKPDSCLVAACRAVGEGRADAVVSAGNTGAMLAAGLLHLAACRACCGPAIAVVIPARFGPSVLIDSGANADARPEHLLQFAHMGAVFAEEILEVAEPRGAPALDRRGAREGQPADARGARAARRERAQLRRQHREPRPARGRSRRRRHRRLHRQRRAEAARGDDQELLDELRAEIRRHAAREARRPADPAGGAPAARAPRPGHLRRRLLLGLRGLSVVAHGNSSSRAIANAIRLAARGVEHGVVGRLASRCRTSFPTV